MYMQKWVIGIDEAGRGPLAGPVAVGVVLVSPDFDWDLLPGVNDSKQLAAKKREEIFTAAQRLHKEEKLRYSVALVSAKVIDKKGIVPAIKVALARGLKQVINAGKETPQKQYNGVVNCIITPAMVRVLLDGGLRAPREYTNQATIIKGDSKEKVIGLASIMAKVTRDRYMVRRCSLLAFSPYCFATHKGYGTKAHREAIANHGLSAEHRVTFCRNIKVSSS